MKRAARTYADDMRAERARQLADRLESVTQWYRDQFEILDDELRSARAYAAVNGGGEERAARKIEAVRRATHCHIRLLLQSLRAPRPCTFHL